MRGTSMGSRMWTLLVFSALFHLLQAQHFGDMLSVSKGLFRGRPLYMHWAVSVDNPPNGLVGRNPNQNLFHINSAWNIRLSACQYGTIGNSHYVVNNYLDGEATVQTPAQMVEQINQLNGNCGRWWPRAHNCEHVATLIRYGFQNSEQRGTWAERLMRRYNQKMHNAGKRSLYFLFEHGSSLAAAGA